MPLCARVRVSRVPDQIAVKASVQPVAFTRDGVLLSDGTELRADLVVFATGSAISTFFIPCRAEAVWAATRRTTCGSTPGYCWAPTSRGTSLRRVCGTPSGRSRACGARLAVRLSSSRRALPLTRCRICLTDDGLWFAGGELHAQVYNAAAESLARRRPLCRAVLLPGARAPDQGPGGRLALKGCGR